MKVIDEVLAAFEDGQWHSLIEAGRQVKLDDFKVGVVFEFLAEYGFIEMDEKGLNGKLEPQYQTFLKQLKSLQALDQTGMTARKETTVAHRPFPAKKTQVKKKGDENLDDLLLEVVDETLRQVFKEAGTRAIYNLLESEFHFKREEIVEKSEVFSAGLERLLGSAALVIEKLILENLYRKLGLKFEEKEGYEFSDYIKELMRKTV